MAQKLKHHHWKAHYYVCSTRKKEWKEGERKKKERRKERKKEGKKERQTERKKASI
jgi:hypothetical protein